MIVCHICGAQNDPANRFCDQCGARLDPTSAAAEATAAEQPAAVQSITCPTCGAPALPGQAFCDSCGYDLRDISVPEGESSPEAPTQMAPQSVQPDTETMVAEPDATEVSEPAEGDTETVTAQAFPSPAGSESADMETITAEPSTQETLVEPSPAEVEAATEETLSVSPPPEAEEKPAESATTTTTTVDVTTSEVESAADKEALQQEIARHQATITQLEEMIQTYPEGSAPAYLSQGLAEARKALQEAEKHLHPSAEVSEPDPAEIARLEQLISVHKGTIAQFEQMKSNYPAGAAPAFLQEGLKEAQSALEHAEKQLAAVKEGKPLVEPAVAPASTKKSSGPRLELFDGKHEFPLSLDRTEFIIGREDPVSQIFPEIDLTSFGGEAGGVSRQHARINHTSDQWTVTDLDSTNHTRVDGQRIEPNTPTPITDGTRLQFGRIAAIFRT
jgi:hypothetical protein